MGASTAMAALLLAPAGVLANWNQPFGASPNVDPTQSGGQASLTSIGGVPYVAWFEFNGTRNQIHVAQLTPGGWSAVGGSLNISQLQDAGEPSITSIAGVPYVAWAEGNNPPRTKVYVAQFTGGAWSQVGTMALNVDTTHNAGQPSITNVAGVPYVAWSENNGASTDQVFVKSFDGSNWNLVGSNPLNIDPSKSAENPSLTTVAGVPYVAWWEASATVHKINVAQFNGSMWSPAGGALNTLDAHNPSIAGIGGVPYAAWYEANGSNKSQIRVAQFNGSMWSAVGGSLNIDQTQNAANPSLAGIGGMPYVAWHELSATANNQVHVAHFTAGSWSPIGGSPNVDPTKAARDASLIGIGGVPYVAWAESNGTNNEIRVKRLEPDIGAESATPSLMGATLSAQINDFGVPLPLGFDYGATSSFGTQTPLQTSSGGGSTTVTQSVTGLASATTFFFRAFGSDRFRETSQGATQTFRTLTPQPMTPGPVVISNAFTFTLGTDNKGDVIATIHDPGAGTLTGSATSKVKGKLRIASAARKHHKKKQARTLTYGTASTTSTGAGTVTLTIRPTQKAKKALKKAKRLNVAVSVTYSPTGGTPRTQTASITVKQAKKKHHHR
ncbi:MAG TPA: hypothetical protein VGY97_08910 [Solirubrobacteraceae bacterium]|nr:hypothetical protein [Solirubrobacteraceae bacterium]